MWNTYISYQISQMPIGIIASITLKLNHSSMRHLFRIKIFLQGRKALISGEQGRCDHKKAAAVVVGAAIF